jgi:tetratricopeptide (TPR) repeat protein
MAFDKVKAIRAAEKHLAQGKVPAAIDEYQRITEHDAGDFTSLNTLGDLYARVGRKQEAVACYSRVAEHYRVQGFALKAVAMFKKVTRFTPDDTETAVTLATLYEQQGLLVEARAQYLTVGDLLARRGHAREALEMLQRVCDLDPNNTDIRLRLAEGFERESMPAEAAQCFTEAADRLAARGLYEASLESYTRALSLEPKNQAALHGLLTAHVALGTADDAADVLEEALRNDPEDRELRAMLVRAYVEAEDAERAEHAAEELVARDQSSYTYLFDVARLCLQQSEVGRAVSLLGRIIETALTGREDARLLELLEEALRCDPEHLAALLLLARIYEWQRNDTRLRTTLERLAEAAEASCETEEERKALARLIQLGADDPQYYERLEALGGAPDLEDTYAPAPAAESDVPTFESFMLPDETPHATPDPGDNNAAPDHSSEFSWATVPPEEKDAPDPSASFADLNAEFTDGSGASRGQAARVETPETPVPVFGDFQEVDFGVHAAQVPESRPPSRERALRQELESVDFYITQGYTDIARDTLDLLEQQYGAHPGIDERRERLATPEAAATVVESFAPAAPAAAEPVAEVSAEEPDEFDAAFAVVEAQTVAPARPASSNGAGKVHEPSGTGIDPGLAAIFDEFREAVEEDVEPESAADFETHYDLGLAYKDIEMYDQAVESFQQAIQSVAPGDATPRYLQCCNMLGHCFIRKGMPKLAAMWFRKGLDSPGHTEDEYQALRYELGTAYEQMGDIQRAFDTFTEVYGIDVTYRGVSEKLRELQEHMTVTSEA